MDKELEKAIIIFKNLDMGNDTEFIKARKVIVEELENSVSKDKIREKIAKLDKEEKDLQNSISDEEREEYSDASIGYALSYIEAKREILKELLEVE